MIISILLLLIAAGGVFISSGCFVDECNDIKKYIVLISTSILLLLLTFYRKPILKLKQTIDNNVFSYGLIILSLLLSIQGILQYFKILQSNNTNFVITGSFENPAGFVAIQTLLFPVLLYNAFKKDNHKYLRLTTFVVSILAFVTTVISGSRCGILAISSSILILSFTETKLNGTIMKNIKFILTFFIVFVICLYYLKEDSANGRILIWRICLNMIKDSPVFGFGHNGFLANYMLYQAEYLAAHNQSPYSFLADNMNHPLNEYIKLTVEYGIVGLTFAFFVLYVIIKVILEKSKEKRGLGLSLISTVLILCQFSYPFNYAVFTFFVILLLILVLPVRVPMPGIVYYKIRNLVRAIMLFFVFICIYDCYYNYIWTDTFKCSLKGKSDNVMFDYKYLLSKITYNTYFLYNYSAELNYRKRYKESNEVARLFTDKLNDYDVQLLLADNYFNLRNYEEAFKKYKTASNMIPSRFIPLGKMMNIYLLESDTAKATDVAKQILSKPIKVPSGEVYRIRKNAETLLKDCSCYFNK